MNASDLTWCVVGGKGIDPKGAPVPLNPNLSAALATAYNAAQPVPTPTPVTPAVTLPALTRKVSWVQTDAEGIRLPAGKPAVLTDTHVEGFGQNIIAENVPSLTLQNVRTVRAFSSQPFDGQGLYIDNCPSVNIRGLYSSNNGWQPGKPLWQRSWYKHGAYLNFGAKNVVIDTAIFANIPEAGVMLRGGGTIRRAVFLNCGIGVSAIMGNVSLDELTIYDGGMYATDTGKPTASWGGNVGIYAWCPVTANNVWIVGRPGQEKPDTTPPTAVYPGSAINTSRKWPGAGQADHSAYVITGGSITATNCVIAGWPGKTFDGDAPTSQAGWTVKPNGASFDYSPILAKIEANQIPIDEAYLALRDGIRGAVK